MGSIERRRLRIGVDVGSTNTDGVILDPARAAEPDKGIVAWHKAATTTNPSLGIGNAIAEMMRTADIESGDVASVTIGTTHFVNAMVERDARRLSPVAVLRLCGPFSHHTPPCVDWPDDMRALVLKHYAILPGGLEVDGSLIADINASAIETECAVIKAKNIRSIVICGRFSPIDTVQCQEERTAEIIRRVLPGYDVVISKDVASLGFVERENAAILNAAILAFARKTIHAFHEPMQRLGL
jgi:N-methylhydantoinase A/oxoprolinase/acetone carboxylase beta subunit